MTALFTNPFHWYIAGSCCFIVGSLLGKYLG